MLPLILRRVGVALLSDCILFLAVCTESDGNLNKGLAMRLQFCVSYDLRRKSLINIDGRVCVCMFMCVCVCVCMRVGGVFHITPLNETVVLV